VAVVKYGAVDAVAVADGDVEGDHLVEIGRREAQRLFEGRQEVGDDGERDILRRLLVVPLPHLVVHVEVVLRQTLLHVLRRLNINIITTRTIQDN